MSRGQCFSTVLVMKRMAKESTLGPTNAGALSMTNGATTFTVDVRDLQKLEIVVALVPCLLSNVGVSPSLNPSSTPNTQTKDL